MRNLLPAGVVLLAAAIFAFSGPMMAAAQSISNAPYKPVQGGTGTNVKPAYGQVLLGDGSGNYAVVATSSLGISGTGGGAVSSVSGTYPIQISPTTGAVVVSTAFGTSTANTFGSTQTFNNLTVTGTCTGCSSGAGITSFGPAGQLQSGSTQTLGTTTSTTNGVTSALTITATGNLTTFKPSTSGTLTIAGGGTGQVTKTAGFDALSPFTTTGDLLVGGLSGTGIRLGIGTGGFVLASVNGTAAWVATSSINNGVSSLQQLGGGSAQTGALTLATSSQTTNGLLVGLNVTNSGQAFTLSPTISGTLGIAGGGTATTTGGNTNGVEYYDGTEITNNPNLAFDSSTNQLSIPRINLSSTAGSPTLGIYDNSGNLGFSVGGSNRFNMSSTLLASATAGAGGFLTAATSGTSPAFAPNKADLTTGLGADSSGNLSLITSGTTKLEIAGANVGIGTTTPGSLLSIGGTGTGWNFYDNATTTKNGVGGVNISQGCYAVAGVCLTSGFGGGVTSIQQTGGGTAQTGAITFSTTTDSFNGLQANENITNSGGAFTFANNITGTLNVTGGGTGLSSLASGSLAYGSGSTALTALAAGTPGQVLGIVGGVPAWVATSTGGSGSGTVGTGTQGQFPFYNANGTTLTATSTISLAQNKTLSFNTDFVHMGTSTCTLGLTGNGSSGAEICGNTNTPGGLILQVENDSNSPSAFDGLNFDNDQSTSALTFGGVFFNSSTYNFTGYGTALAVPSNLSLENTQGSVSIIAASTTPGGAYLNFLTGGPNTGNELGRFNQSSFLVGTTTGVSSTIGTVVVHPQTNTKNAFAITNTQGTTTLEADTLDNAANVAIIASSTGQNYLRVSAGGPVVFVEGTSTPVLSSCGTSPSILNGGALKFSIQVGSVAATGCTATFPNAPLPIAPVCNVTERTGSITNSFAYTVSTSAVVVTQTGLTGDIIDVNCTEGNTS